MLAPTLAGAQSSFFGEPFPENGDTLKLEFTEQPEDFTIPVVDPPGFVLLSARGGRGGSATATVAIFGTNCPSTSPGGKPARLEAVFEVGYSDGQLRPGGTLRFLVGEGGMDLEWGFPKKVGAGGGGGTGVLYCADGSCTDEEWTPLLVAGGGGGGFKRSTAFFCGPGQEGLNASLSEDGVDGQNHPDSGGVQGSGGLTSNESAGSGGGLYGSAECVSGCSDEAVNGQLGAVTGGLGGQYIADNDAWEGPGGWGCGGGGAGGVRTTAFGTNKGIGGGGGGGYSGGGHGRNPSGANSSGGGGGGGGSYISPIAVAADAWIATGPAGDGWAELTAVAAQDGYSCSTAVVIPDLQSPGYGLSYIDSTEGGAATVFESCAQGANPTPDDWYSFTNSLDCERSFEFFILDLGFVSSSFVEVFDECGGTPITCHEFEITFPDFTPLEVIVPPGETRWFRIESASSGSGINGMEYQFDLAIVALGDDSDGDGVPDCVDNCPLTSNSNQDDADGDGVGDACDLCPGDDLSDVDNDGIPDGCDVCHGGDDLADIDLDGVPDSCDTCIGENNTDIDGDGVPDACDPCVGGDGIDCNGNGIDDICDMQGILGAGRWETFENAEASYRAMQSDYPEFPIVDDQAMILTAGDLQEGHTSTVSFDPLSPYPITGFYAEFVFSIDKVEGNGAHGLSFSLFDAGLYDETTLFAERGLDAGSLSLSFDVYKHNSDPNDNHVELLVDGVSVAVATPSFVLEDGTPRRAIVDLEDGHVTVHIEDFSGASEQLFHKVPVPSFTPFIARYGFGARSGSNNTATIRVDQIRFNDHSASFLVDSDFNQALDACQGSQVVELGSPPNPNALIPGADPGLVLGSTYEPYIDHSNFMSGSLADFLIISLSAGNVVLPDNGTLLVGPAAIPTLVESPGSAFSLKLSNSTALMGLTVYMQGMSYRWVDFGLPEAKLTNAIQAEIGGWQY